MAFADMLVGFVEHGKALERHGASDEQVKFFILQLRATRAQYPGYDWENIMRQIIDLLPVGHVAEKLRKEFLTGENPN